MPYENIDIAQKLHDAQQEIETGESDPEEEVPEYDDYENDN